MREIRSFCLVMLLYLPIAYAILKVLIKERLRNNMKKLTQDDHDMFNHLENFGMIDAIALDQVIFKSKFQSLFISENRLWQKFIRSI